MAVSVTDQGSSAPVIDWLHCARCGLLLYGKRFERDLSVCRDCGWHGRLTAHERLEQLLDAGWEPLGTPETAADPLSFVDTQPYHERLARARARTGLRDAVVPARGTVDGWPAVVAAMDFRFLGGSLGTAVGEWITLAAERARSERVPLVLVTASGGARMQEGALSLMQMVKTSQALAELDEAGILTVAVVTDPTYGGVAASYASLADVILAEPGARMGFAGPRVIEQTIRRSLPEGFQSAEFLYEHGLVDDVVPRAQLRSRLARLLACAGRRRTRARAAPADVAAATGDGEQLPATVRDAADLEPAPAWETVNLARHGDRPTTLDYVAGLLEGFQELHGDRASEDCPAVVGGLGRLGDRGVVVVGHQKGHDTRELVRRNFGMASPAGYRKSARLLRLAAKLGVPVVTFIDTPGAYPGPEAEERGQAIAIAENLRLLSGLPVPVVALVTGEGGSGGALALGVADRVLMLEHATYSVISPEGCAAILWQEPAAAATAAEALRLTPSQLLRLGIVDGVVREPPGGAHQDPVRAVEAVGQALVRELAALDEVPAQELVARRRARFRRFGT